MAWPQLLSYLFGGAVMANAVPHVVAGLMGRPFQTPFAKPPKGGLSSSTVNIVWGFFNIAIAYLLVCKVGDFNLKDTPDVAAFGLGALALSVMLARRFGRFNGGNAPERA